MPLDNLKDTQVIKKSKNPTDPRTKDLVDVEWEEGSFTPHPIQMSYEMRQEILQLYYQLMVVADKVGEDYKASVLEAFGEDGMTETHTVISKICALSVIGMPWAFVTNFLQIPDPVKQLSWDLAETLAKELQGELHGMVADVIPDSVKH